MFYFDFPRHAPPSPRWGFHAHPSPLSELSPTFASQGERGNKYQYNGIELIDDFGLNANQALYRTLDPQLGRWWQPDPKAEEFYGWSPYHSNMDNPVRYQDPEGDFPWNIVIGAAVGAAADFGFQVAEGLASGKGVTESIKDVNYRSVGISAVAGGLSGGLSAFAPKTTAIKVAKAVAETALNAVESAAKQVTSDEGVVTIEQTVSDVLPSRAAAYSSSKAPNVIKTKVAERQLDRANRIAKNSPTKQPKQIAAQKAAKTLKGMNIANQVINETRSEVYENALQTMSNKIRETPSKQKEK